MLQTQWTKDGVEIADVDPGPLEQGWVRLKVSACGNLRLGFARI